MLGDRYLMGNCAVAHTNNRGLPILWALYSSPPPPTYEQDPPVCQLFAANKAIIDGFLETDLECLEISEGKRQVGIEVGLNLEGVALLILTLSSTVANSRRHLHIYSRSRGLPAVISTVAVGALVVCCCC